MFFKMAEDVIMIHNSQRHFPFGNRIHDLPVFPKNKIPRVVLETFEKCFGRLLAFHSSNDRDASLQVFIAGGGKRMQEWDMICGLQ